MIENLTNTSKHIQSLEEAFEYLKNYETFSKFVGSFINLIRLSYLRKDRAANISVEDKETGATYLITIKRTN